MTNYHLIPLLSLLFLSATCPFCENPNDQKELQERLVHEGDLVRVLYDRAPSVPGHLLIIPKRHVERIEHLSSEEWSEIHQTIKKINHLYRIAYQKTDYLVLLRNGKGAGQKVFHVHFHLYPADFPPDQEILEEIAIRKDRMPRNPLRREVQHLRTLWKSTLDQ